MLELDQVLESIRATAYRWDFNADTIEWAANAGTVLGSAPISRAARTN
jgi:hypothetical protein